MLSHYLYFTLAPCLIPRSRGRVRQQISFDFSQSLVPLPPALDDSRRLGRSSRAEQRRAEQQPRRRDELDESNDRDMPSRLSVVTCSHEDQLSVCLCCAVSSRLVSAADLPSVRYEDTHTHPYIEPPSTFIVCARAIISNNAPLNQKPSLPFSCPLSTGHVSQTAHALRHYCPRTTHPPNARTPCANCTPARSLEAPSHPRSPPQPSQARQSCP